MKQSILYFVFLAPALFGYAQDAAEPAQPAEPSLPEMPLQLKYSSSSGRDRVVIGNVVRVKEGETVNDLVVIGGAAIIDGKVTGDFVVVGGKAQLGPTAEVKRDLVVVAGALNAHTNSTVGGDRVVIGFDTDFKAPAIFRWVEQWFTQGLMLGRPLPHQYPWAWVVAAIFLVLYLLIALLFPGPVRAGMDMLQTRPGSSLLTGLLAFLLFGPLIVLLLITVIGSILVPFLFCGAVAAYFFGKVVVYGYAGHQIGGRRFQKPLMPVLIGAILFSLLYAIPFLGFLVWGIVAPLGVGAVLLAFFRRLRSEEPKPPGPPQPTVPPPAPYGVPAGGATASASAMSMALPKAGFWLRFLGTVIDAILIGTICRLLNLDFGKFIFVWTVYHIALWGLKGATIGGIVVGTRILRTDGTFINFSVAVVRSLASFLSAAALMLGFFWAGWNPHKQSWHDIIAGTFVVKTSRAVQPSPVPAAQAERA